MRILRKNVKLRCLLSLSSYFKCLDLLPNGQQHVWFINTIVATCFALTTIVKDVWSVLSRYVITCDYSLHLQGRVIVFIRRSSEAERSRSKLANCLAVDKKYVLFCQI